MLTINGQSKDGYDGIALLDVLEKEQYNIRQIAVEINGEIVPRASFPERVLSDGDCVEVVSFVGGG